MPDPDSAGVRPRTAHGIPPESGDRRVEQVSGSILGAEIVDLVERYYYDRPIAAAWAHRHRDYARRLKDPAAVQRETRVRLAELGASHTDLYTPDDPGFPQILAIFEHLLGAPPDYDSIGLEVAQIDGDWFAVRVFPDGPAARAGIVRGDRLVDAHGAPFHPVRPFRSRSGQSVTVTVQRDAGGVGHPTTVVPIRTSPVEEWRRIQRRSTALWTARGHRVGYCALWCCAGEEPARFLRAALLRVLHEADALVLDLRGGWGGCNPSVLEALRGEVGSRDRKLVLLVDRRTRSGKEVVARLVQRRRWGTVVGERTAGAVLRGRPFRLQDGSVLYLAVQDFRLDEERLEGRGVEPDVHAPCDPRYAAGQDRPLDVALDVVCD